METQDKQSRINSFMAEYEALVKKHAVDFSSYPMLVPAQNSTPGNFYITVQSVPVDLKEVASRQEGSSFMAK